jgi:hypothetical protein
MSAHYPTYVYICSQIRHCNFNKYHDEHNRRRSITFPFIAYRDVDVDIWNDVISGITHLFLLILMLARGCPLSIMWTWIVDIAGSPLPPAP